MSGAGDNATTDELREDSTVGGIVLAGASQAVVRAVQRDRRDVDFRTARQLTLDRLEPRLALRVQVAVAIRVDDAVDEVRIVERRRGLLVRGIGELPGGRPLLPEQLAERA